ncbi:MAG: GNAT family N-acetyltransferase [Acidimicrobiaceae bacterium]|nr:GNAT family N-acetyltransferase [Acidimicrobiaceae bacterium]
MPRRRLGVALLLDPPAADEVDGLRRSLGDRALGRIPPHLTLVPPVNVAEDDLPDALARLRGAAANLSGPIGLVLGPPDTFLPANPVLYLRVGGDTDALARVRAAVFAGPLRRGETWPWVPHVTLADEADPARIEAALGVLGGFRAGFDADRIVLLEERATPTGRRWTPLADALFGPRHVVGRGGLELELSLGRLIDPEAAAFLRAMPESAVPEGAEVGERRAPFPLLCVARRREGPVGVGAAWWSDWRGHLGVAVDPVARRQGVGSQILARLESALAAAGWDGPGLETLGPPGFYRRSRLAQPRGE